MEYHFNRSEDGKEQTASKNALKKAMLFLSGGRQPPGL